MGSLLNAAPLAGGGTCHGPAARPAVPLPVPMRHASIISLALKLFHLHWSPSGRSGLQFPVGSSPLVSGRFLATGVPLVALGLYPACPSRVTCGQFIPTCFRPVPLALLPAGSTQPVSDRWLSAASRSVPRGWLSVGSSRLASGRALTVSFRHVARSVLPAHTPCMVSVSRFATNEPIMQVGPPVGPQLRILNLNT